MSVVERCLLWRGGCCGEVVTVERWLLWRDGCCGEVAISGGSTVILISIVQCHLGKVFSVLLLFNDWQDFQPNKSFLFSMTDFMNMDMNMKAISCFLIGLKFLSMRE